MQHEIAWTAALIYEHLWEYIIILKKLRWKSNKLTSEVESIIGKTSFEPVVEIIIRCVAFWVG